MVKKRILTDEEKQQIVNLYVNEKQTTNAISGLLHLNKDKIYQVLEENSIPLRKKGELNTKVDIYAVKEFNKTPKYIPRDGFTFVAISKKDGTEFADYKNQSGALSRYIKKEYNIDAPSNYMSSLYYYNNKSYWFEEYFYIVEKPIEEKVSTKITFTERDKDDIIKLYVENEMKIHDIAALYHVGKKKIEATLDERKIARRKLGEKNKKNKCGKVLPLKENQKFFEKEGFHFIAVSKLDGRVFNDYLNKGGHLSKYIREFVGVETPTLYEMRKYYQETGNYWYEQWFDVNQVPNNETLTIKCPYCNWETIDVEGKSGALCQHIKKEHNKSYNDLLNEFPEYVKYFKTDNSLHLKEIMFQNEDNFVVCPLCGEKMEYLTFSHITQIHQMSYSKFQELFPRYKVVSTRLQKVNASNSVLRNLVVSKNRFISSYEREIQDFLKTNNIEFETNRQMLIGKEIDILIEDKKVGIEFDGLYWHTEKFGGKNREYHVNKTNTCLEKGYKLIHIFEDEYVNHKDIVYDTLKHKLNIKDDKPKISGKKCVVEEIKEEIAKPFIENFNIEGFVSSMLYLGAFYNNELIGVMSIKKLNDEINYYEITRLATNSNYICYGIGGKLFKYFTINYNPSIIITFANRRYCPNHDNNIYTKLGFIFDKITPPDFTFYDKNLNKFKRFNKDSFSKEDLHKIYNLPLSMDYSDMIKESKLDKIWNCGLIKYVWLK